MFDISNNIYIEKNGFQSIVTIFRKFIFLKINVLRKIVNSISMIFGVASILDGIYKNNYRSVKLPGQRPKMRLSGPSCIDENA